MEAIEIDTKWFRGNFPYKYNIEWACSPPDHDFNSLEWKTLVADRPGIVALYSSRIVRGHVTAVSFLCSAFSANRNSLCVFR